MKRRLIIANTYFQLILAIRMKETTFKNDQVVLLVSDHSKNSEEIVKSLNKNHVFYQTIFFKSLDVLKKRNLIDKFIDNFSIAFLKKNRYSYYLKSCENFYFDEMIYYNHGIDMYGVYSILSEYNPKIRVSFFEEGILSYNQKIYKNIQTKLIKIIRHIRKKKDISESMVNFYCFYPELYKGKLTSVGVPPIELKSNTAFTLQKVFQIKRKDLNYKPKYIFFTSVYDFEGESIEEYELVTKIREIVGNENLLIKLHPRDLRDIYIKNGFNIDSNSSIPWEVIQLSADFSNNVFLTATSGSVLAGSFLSEAPVSIIYLYKLCKISHNLAAKNTVNNIECLLESPIMKSQLSNIKVANSLSEIKG